jgi:hypothetical protein
MKTVLVLLTVILVSACSSTHPYETKGEPNFDIDFKSGGAFMKSTDLEVAIFEYLPNCKAHYMGTVELSRNNKTSIFVPVGKNIGVRTFFHQGGFFSNTEYTNADSEAFRMVTKKSETYLLEVEEDDGAIGRHIYANRKGKKVELEFAKFNSNCKEYQDEE